MAESAKDIPSCWYENAEGVHFAGVDGEHMLCGDAFDGQFTTIKGQAGGTQEIEEMHPTHKRVVTCPNCIALLKHVKGVRYRAK